MLLLLANVAYVLMLVAFVTRDILKLRSLLVAAQLVVVIYAWSNGVRLVSTWNLLFAGINAYMVVQILRERRAVVLSPELRAVHQRHFAALSPPEFLRWWKQGRREALEDERLVRAGEHPEWLYFLLGGRVRVIHEGRADVELPAGYFVAEMSLLTGEPANADVDAVGAIDVMRWPTRDLRDLRERNPALWARIQSVIGHDLVEKIQRGGRIGPSSAAAP